MTKSKEKSIVSKVAAKSENVFASPAVRLLGIEAEATNVELLDIGVREFNRSGLCMAKAGMCFMALKDRMPPGEFLKALEERGVEPRGAQMAMQTARWLASLPEDKALKFVSLPNTKVLALAQADPEVVSDLMETGEIDDVTNLSVRALRKALHKAELHKTSLETKLETVDAKYEKLQHHLQHRHDKLDMPVFAADAREEAAIVTEKMIISISGLEELAKTALLADRAEPDADRFQRAAAGTLYYALMPVAARACALLKSLTDTFEGIDAGVKFEHQLTKGEATHYLKARGAVLEEMSRDKRNREAVRENNREGKRGRKRSIEQ